MKKILTEGSFEQWALTLVVASATTTAFWGVHLKSLAWILLILVGAAVILNTGRTNLRIARSSRRHSELNFWSTRVAALYDENLGLYQPWYLEMRLLEESRRCLRYGLSMSLIVVKLSSESLRNLREGAWQPDATQAAYLTARTVRAVDLTAVIGPTEFAICLVHCDRTGAESAIARLQEALKKYEPLIGAVVFPEDKVESKHMLQLARSRAVAPRESDGQEESPQIVALKPVGDGAADCSDGAIA